MNKYLIKDIDVDINLECDDDIYYPTEVIKDTYIDADSPKQAFLEFVKKLEDDLDSYGLYDARYDLVWPIADFDTLEEIGYGIDLYCTWYDYCLFDEPVKLSAVVEQVDEEEVKRYLIGNTFVNLLDNSVDYYETDSIPSHCIEARSSEEALRVFIENLEGDEDLGYYDFELETLNPFVWPLVVAGSETIGYTISASCTWVDADCYTHDDGPVELTFAVTEVHDMIPEEF